MAMNLQRVVLIFGLLLSVSAEAFDSYKTFRRDTWDFEVNAHYFTSEKNFDSSGKTESLPSGYSYNLLDTTIETRYTPRRTFSFFSALNIANSEAKDTVATRKNSSITDVLLGMDFLIFSGAVDVIPEGFIKIPFYPIDPAADDSMNAEGVMEVGGRISLQKDLRPVGLFGYLGFNYRGDGRSFLMPWGGGVQFRATRRWLLGAELFGYQSVTDDQDTSDQTARNSHIATVNAGSMAFYSVNPNVIDSRLFLQYRITRPLTIGVDGGMTLAGKNIADGYHLGGFIRYSFDLSSGYVPQERAPEPAFQPVPTYKSNMYKDANTLTDSEVKKFKEDTKDGVDQKIFKPAPTKKPKPPPRVGPPADDFTVELKGPTKKKRVRRSR